MGKFYSEYLTRRDDLESLDENGSITKLQVKQTRFQGKKWTQVAQDDLHYQPSCSKLSSFVRVGIPLVQVSL
jgi:hypothetical protein